MLGFSIQFFGLSTVLNYFGIVFLVFFVVIYKDLDGKHFATKFAYVGMPAIAPFIALITAILASVLGRIFYFYFIIYLFLLLLIGEGMQPRGPWCWIQPEPPYIGTFKFFFLLFFYFFLFKK